MTVRRFSFPTTWTGVRADKAVAVVAGVSRNVAKQLIDEGGVLVNGNPPQARTKVLAGDIVSFEAPDARDAVAPNRQITFEVLYEDDDLAVVNKPPEPRRPPRCRASRRYPRLRGPGALAVDRGRGTAGEVGSGPPPGSRHIGGDAGRLDARQGTRVL